MIFPDFVKKIREVFKFPDSTSTEEEAGECLKQAKKKLQGVQGTADKWNQRHLKEWAEKMAQQQEIEKESVICSILNAEATRRAFQQSGWAIRGEQRGAITRLLVLDPADLH